MPQVPSRVGVLAAVALCISVLRPLVAAPRGPDVGQQSTGTALLAGRVVTTDATPQPVRRAIVTLSGSGLDHSRSAITDDGGRFVFGALAGGRFTVTASRPAFITSAYGAKQPGRPGTSITLAPGQQLTDIVIRLAKGAVVTGVIRDQDGEVMANVQVAVVRAGAAANTAPGFPPAANAIMTDDRGVYRAFGLEPGKYFVASSIRMLGGGDVRALSSASVDAALQDLQRRSGRLGGAGSQTAGRVPGSPGSGSLSSAPSQVYAPIFFPGTPNPSNATTVTLAAGEERTGIDLIVRPIPSATIEGVVVSPSGAPPGIQLSLTPETTVSLPVLFGSQPSLAMPPGPDGRFKYAGVIPGRYTIAARSTSVAQGRGGGVISSPGAPPAPSGPGAPPMLWAMADVSVDGNDVGGVTLTLQPALRLAGRIVFDRTTLTPPEDLTTVRVNLTQASGTGGSMVINSAMLGRLPIPPAQVRADGTFEFNGVLPGTYRIAASVPTEPRWWLRSAMVGTRDVLDIGLDVTASGDLPGAVVTFSDRRTELSGTLQTSAGAPAPDYYVVVFSADRAHWRPQSRRLSSTRPGNDGRFVIRDLPPGEYLLAALTDFDPDEWQTPEFLDQLIPASIKVSLGEGEQKTQDVKIAR